MKVVIIGGGFSGIKAARILRKKHEVILIEQNDHFVLKPLLYEFVVGSLSEETVCRSLRKELGSKVSHIKGIATEIDMDNRQVSVKSPDQSAIIRVPYDYLLVTTGAYIRSNSSKNTLNPYNLDSAKKMKEEMQMIRERIRNHEKLNVGIVGGGPAGVELACIIKEFIEYQSKKYHNANIHNVIIYNSSEVIMNNFSFKLASMIRARLVMKGIKVENFCLVRQVESKNDYYNVHYQRDGKIDVSKHDIVLWSGGIEKSRIGKFSFETDRYFRTKTNRHVFASGDAVNLEDKKRKIPELAILAIDQGEIAAKNIMRASRSIKLKPYNPRIKGMSIITGRREGISIIRKKIIIKGFLGWFISRLSYVSRITSPQNRIRSIKRLIKESFSKNYPYLDEDE